jgi:hypothetical protein
MQLVLYPLTFVDGNYAGEIDYNNPTVITESADWSELAYLIIAASNSSQLINGEAAIIE